MIKKGIFLMLLLGQHLSVQAELIEIADHGGLSPSLYYERITKDDPEENTPMGQPLNSDQVDQYALKNRLPIQSKLLTPGRVKPRKWQQQAFMGTSIALIGYDKASVKWLKLKKKQLQQQGTVIMLVNVKTELQFKKIQAFLPNNQILAMSGDDVARQLNIRHYPVLITSKGVEQ